MGFLLLPKETIQSARTQLRRVMENEKLWDESTDRQEAMKKYPNEYVVVSNLEIIEHSKDFNVIVKKLRERDSKGEDLAEMFTDHLVKQKIPKTRKQLIKELDDIVRKAELNPIANARSELFRKAYGSLSPEDLKEVYYLNKNHF